jgi:hypothetical protein
MGSMHVVEDAKLTEGEKLRKEGAWNYYRRHYQKGRIRVEHDEESEFAKMLPRWLDAPDEEELRDYHGTKNGSGSDSDTSTQTQWPRFKPKTDPETEQLKRMDELNNSPRKDHRLELIHPDKFGMANLDRYRPGAIGSDGFETQALTGPPGPMPREIGQRSASLRAPPLEQREPHQSYLLPANETAMGRSLTHPIREIPKPVQRANSKFAEQI